MYPWQLLQEQLRTALATCTREHRPYLKMLECCFHISERSWQECQQYIHEFKNEEEEIQFFKVVKPHFTSTILYYHLVYQAELFAPVEDETNITNYWQREQGKREEFRAWHGCFLAYYRMGLTDRDTYWYTRAALNRDVKNVRLYDTDNTIVTNGDPLLASWYALTRYQLYCRMRLNRQSNPNSYFLFNPPAYGTI